MQVSLTQIDELVCDASLESILRELVDTPSATGDEAQLARLIVSRLHSFGLTAEEQVIDATQSNALGVLKGRTSAKRLLLYAPIDTVTSNDATEDLPWVGKELRADMIAKSYVDEAHIFGLGAHNPKGHAAAILEAARVLASIRVQLAGDVLFGFGAGGMPTFARAGKREGSGHGAGCDFMLSQIEKPDAAIIAKSGWAVSWEEVGFLWIDVLVEGTHTYVGSRHLLPYSNAIESASRLIVELERWFEERAETCATPLIKPQAVVSYIESGWQRMPAFTPASCRFRVDFRYGPHSDRQAAEHEFAEQLGKMASSLKVTAEYKVVQTIPATRTSPDSEIIQKTIRAWEQVAGATHSPNAHTSGATDANILRAGGIPTARVGLPKAQVPEMDFQLGMNSVAKADLRRLTKLLVAASLNYFEVSTLG